MSDVKLGVTPENDAETDAVHMAVAPVLAAMDLRPGDRVGLIDGKALRASQSVAAIGVVDPFRTEHVRQGQRFWLCLFPGTVTGMRHHWSHPAFVNATPKAMEPGRKAEAEKWLRDFATEWSMSYEDMLAAAAAGNDHFYAGTDLHSREELGADYDRLWDMLEIVLDRRFSQSHRDGVGFRCGC
jgi:hypothetical protein